MSKQDRYSVIMTELKDKSERVTAIWDAAGDAALDERTKQEVITLNKEIDDLEHEAKELDEQRAMRDRAQQFKRYMDQPAPGQRLPNSGVAPQERREPQGEKAARALAIGEHVLSHEQFKSWREAIMVGAAITSAKFGHSPRVSLPGGVKALLTGGSATSAGALVDTQFLGLRDQAGVYQRPLTIRDLITNGTTNSDTVSYAKMGAVTNNAAPVAEATAASGSTGAKPESDMALSVEETNVKTIAHWIPATRQALADAGQLRTLIDAFLRYGLEEELEDQILTGSGTGQNFTGVLNTSGTQTQAFDTNILTTTRKARTKVRVNGRATPTGYVMHPNDWETIDLLQDNEGRYYYGGPSVLGMPRLWGVPVVESEGMTEGTSVLADWRWAVLWDREQANIMVSDSHSDFFIRNLIAILAELRAAFAVLRPAAFVEIDMAA